MNPTRRDLEQLGQQMAELINSLVGHPENRFGKKIGFCLVLFDFDGEWQTYTSNAEREGMVDALRQVIERMPERPGMIDSEN